jgi:hypothetical protein
MKVLSHYLTEVGMKTGTLIISLLVLFGLAITPALAAIDVGYVNVKPTGDLEAGKTNVTVDFQIDFISVGGETFPSADNILLSTQLENPVWNWAIILDGVENTRPPSSKNQLSLSGWELSYKDKEEQVKVTLKGNAPKTEKSKEIEIVSVNVASPNGRIKETVRNVTAFLTNPGELSGDIGTARTKVKKLQTDIAELKADGIDVSNADKKAKEASNSLEQASKENFASAKIYIQNAETFIKDAYGFLDMGIAKKTISDAKEAIDRTDEWITYFKTDLAMEADPRLAPIITKREFAAEYVSNAQDLFEQNKYTEAKNKAQDANEKAIEIFEETQKLNATISQTPVSSGPDFGAILGLLIYPVIGIIIIAVAIVVYRLLPRGGNGGGKGGSGKGGGGSFGWKKRTSSKSKKSHQYDELF